MISTKKIWAIKKKIGEKVLALYLLFYLPFSAQINVRQDKALGMIAGIVLIVIAVFFIVVFASIYFVLTTPPGQTGLAAIGMQIANAIADPFIQFFNGIGGIFKHYLNPANW